MSCGKAIKLYCIKHEHPQSKTRRIFILPTPTDKAIEDNKFEPDSPLLLLFTNGSCKDRTKLWPRSFFFFVAVV